MAERWRAGWCDGQVCEDELRIEGSQRRPFRPVQLSSRRGCGRVRVVAISEVLPAKRRSGWRSLRPCSVTAPIPAPLSPKTNQVVREVDRVYVDDSAAATVSLSRSCGGRMVAEKILQGCRRV